MCSYCKTITDVIFVFHPYHRVENYFIPCYSVLNFSGVIRFAFCLCLYLQSTSECSHYFDFKFNKQIYIIFVLDQMPK